MQKFAKLQMTDIGLGIGIEANAHCACNLAFLLIAMNTRWDELSEKNVRN